MIDGEPIIRHTRLCPSCGSPLKDSHVCHRTNTGRPRQVLKAIDQALDIQARNPNLFATKLRDNRDCLSLVTTATRIQHTKPRVSQRPDRDEVERVATEWETEFAERNASRFTRNRPKEIDRLRITRTAMDPIDRVQAARAEIQLASTVPASQIGFSSKSSSTTAELPHSGEINLDRGNRMVEMAARWFEAIADEIKGRGMRRDVTAMASEEKDALIRDELIDWTPAEIEAFFEGQLGKVRHIESKRRKQFGQFAQNGRRDPDMTYDPEVREYKRAT